MNLGNYLQRIQFKGKARPDLDTLKQVHRQHLLCIPYENLDVQLQRPTDLDLHRMYAKLVEQKRGGWCYEMNGLMEWALREIGFDVMRMCAGVHRAVRGDDALGNHLVLRVQLDQPWLADVGFGDSAIEPVPITAHAFRQRGFDYVLECLDDEESPASGLQQNDNAGASLCANSWWRFHNSVGGADDSFDFKITPADESLLEQQSQWLSTNPESRFVQNLVIYQFTPAGFDSLVGRVRRRVTAQGQQETLVHSAAELLDVLGMQFGLDVPEANTLWDRIQARHEQVFGMQNPA